MNHLDDRRRAMLALGLEAFDRAARRRRARRIALPCLSALALAALAAVLLNAEAPRGAGVGLPASVELIVDDRDLAAELELARACERVDRSEGRLMVVECVSAPPPDVGGPLGEGGDVPVG